jgi:ribose/xylose/arabinose/galactoside ABC-type transport system permease subunit
MKALLSVGKRETGIFALIVLLLILVGIKSPTFLAPANLRDILVQAAPALIVACGMTFVIVTGEIDISVGSLMGLLAAVLGTLTSESGRHLPVIVGIVAILVIGAFVGAINGFLVTVGKIPSIIVTLGMLTLLQGVTELAMGGKWIEGLPPDLRWWGTGHVLGIPVAILVAAVIFALAVFIARDTPLGRRLYAAGDNPAAARLLGLPVDRLRATGFVMIGLMAAVATLISAPQLSVIESGFGRGFELLIVTAVVVGGTSIKGGRGTLLGTLLAVILLAMIRTLLIFLKLGESATYWERSIQGGLILIAVLADQMGQRKSAGAAA